MTAPHDAEQELATLLAEVRRIQVLARRLLTGALSGGYNAAFKGAGLEFHELREYEPGDDPRTMDWNVTARTGRPYIRRHRDERDQTVVFAVDLTRSLDQGMGHWTGRQMATRLAACLALAGVESGDRIGMTLLGDGELHRVAPEKGLSHTLRIVRDCLVMTAGDPAPDRIPRLLDHILHTRRKRSIVFLVSDLLPQGDTAVETAKALRRLSRRHDIVLIQPQGPELTLHQRCRRGLWRVTDPETGGHRTVDIGSGAVRTALEERLRTWHESTRTMLRDAGIDRITGEIPLDEDPDAIARPILRFFRQRAAQAVAP